MNRGKVFRGVLVGLLAVFTSLCFNDQVGGQEKKDDAPCPTPYIKIVKPKLAQPGQEITIRGRRFGEDKASGDVIFSPGLSGRIIYWKNNRIGVEVPPGAQTGEILVKTKCATSNRGFLKVANETSGDGSAGKEKTVPE